MNIELEMRSFSSGELGRKMQLVMAPGEEFDFCFTSIYREYAQMEAALIDPAVYFPEMIERPDQAGAQEIIDKMQAQIDAWLATK